MRKLVIGILCVLATRCLMAVVVNSRLWAEEPPAAEKSPPEKAATDAPDKPKAIISKQMVKDAGDGHIGLRATDEDGSQWALLTGGRMKGWQWKRLTGPAGSKPPQSAPVSGGAAGTPAPARPLLETGLQPRLQSLRSPTGNLMGAIEPWEVWWTRNREKFLHFRQPVKWQEQKQAETITKFQVYDDLFNLFSKALEDNVENIAVMAALGLGKSGDSRAIPLLKKAFQTEKRPMVKDNILIALGIIGDTSAIEMLKSAVYEKKSDEVSRSYAALSLGFLPYTNAANALREIMAQKTDLEVTASACLASGNLKDNSADNIKTLGSFLSPENKKDRRIRCCAALALGRIGGPESIAELKKVISDKDDEVRVSVAVALGLTGRPDAKDLITVLLKDKNTMVQGAAAVSLALNQKTERDTKEIYDILLKILKETKRPEIDGMVALSLGLLGDERAKPELKDIVNRKKARLLLKGAAVIALGLLQDKEAAPILAEMLNKDANLTIQPYITLALGMIGEPSSVEPLQKLWETVDKNAHKIAYTNLAVALTMLGQKDDVVLPAMLKHAAKDQPENLRMCALHTLGLLGNRTTAQTFIEAYEKEKNNGIRYFAITGAGFMMDKNPFPPINKVTADNNNELFMYIMENLLPLPVW